MKFFQKTKFLVPTLLLLLLVIVGSIASYALGRYRADVQMTGKLSTSTRLAEGFRLQTLRSGEASASDEESVYLLPGTELSLQLAVEGKTEVPACLYVEVSGDLEPSALTSDWRLLENVTGKHGGAVYAYREVLNGAQPDQTVQILQAGLIPDADPETEAAPVSFCGYLLQVTSEAGRGEDQARLTFVNRFPQD